MARSLYSQQQSVMSKTDFEIALDEILTESVPLNKAGGPNDQAIAMASKTSRRIIDLVDIYMQSNGVR